MDAIAALVESDNRLTGHEGDTRVRGPLHEILDRELRDDEPLVRPEGDLGARGHPEVGFEPTDIVRGQEVDRVIPGPHRVHGRGKVPLRCIRVGPFDAARQP